MRRRFGSFLVFALASGASLSSVACGPGCDRNPGGPPVAFKDGITDTARGYYESAPPCGPYLDFPGGRTYRFFHGLGAVPANYAASFSFDEFPLAGPCDGGPNNEHPSGMVPGAGSQATFEAVTATYIDVRNDSCSDVRLRVFADDPQGPSGDGGP